MSAAGPEPDAAALRAWAERWLAEDPDPAARAELRAVLDADDSEQLRSRFRAPLTFGTAGLRGPLRAGPAGMNRAVVRRTAAGLAAYLRDTGRDGAVVIGYDARHGSADFARDSGAVFAGAGREALLLPRPLPTPVLAFAVRHLGAAAGVMVTASHNPPRDNGYKVYLGDGAQIAPPTDREIESAIRAVGSLAGVPMRDDYRVLGEGILGSYLDAVAGVVTPGPRDLAVAYTPLHGVGRDVVLAAFERAGFPRPAVVAEQAEPHPDFPTVAFPNPEEPGAMDLVRALAERTGADIAIANDPDADRCAVACGGRILRGDELGVLLGDLLLRRGRAGTYATTIVSSSLLGRLCADRGAPYAETLTGFKWIVRAAGDGGLAYGYEEALGYAVAPEVVRDKDGISAALLVAELAATLKAEGRTLLDRLDEIACQYGVYATDQVAIRVSEPRLIAAAMSRLRQRPPDRLLSGEVTAFDDLLPDADVVRLRARNVRVVVRPSGTEPKLKIYLEVVVPVLGGDVGSARSRASDALAVVRDQLADALKP